MKGAHGHMERLRAVAGLPGQRIACSRPIRADQLHAGRQLHRDGARLERRDGDGEGLTGENVPGRADHEEEEGEKHFHTCPMMMLDSALVIVRFVPQSCCAWM